MSLRENYRRILFLSIVVLTLSLDLFFKWYAGHIFESNNITACPYPHCTNAFLSFGEPCLSASDPLRFNEDPQLVKEIIPNFFYIHLMNNTGAAWSFLSGKNHLFIIFNTLFVLISFYFMLRKNDISLIPYIAFSMIIGGAMGNFYDRLVHNSVRDFLSFLIPLPNGNIYPYPVFNGADIFIFSGATLYLIDQLILVRFRAPKINSTLQTNAKENVK